MAFCDTTELPCLNLDDLLNQNIDSDHFVSTLSKQLGRVGETIVSKVGTAKSQLATLERQVDAHITTTAAGSSARSPLIKELEMFVTNQVDALRSYVVLNVLTALKALKKHDEEGSESSNTAQSEFLDQLSREPWFASSGMHCLCHDTLHLARRLFQHEAPLQTSHPVETCAFCLESLSNPVQLPCSHQFCWSCLTDAAHKRLEHCPLCRTPNSLDPRDFILQPLLADLASAHFQISAPSSALQPTVERLRSELMSASPLLPSNRDRAPVRLNPKAKEFVPISPILNPISPSLNSASSGLHDLVSLTLGSAASAGPKPASQSPREASSEDKLAIAKLRKESKAPIKYSFKQLLALRPLNPNAPTYQPLWMLGIHTPKDLHDVGIPIDLTT